MSTPVNRLGNDQTNQTTQQPTNNVPAQPSYNANIVNTLVRAFTLLNRQLEHPQPSRNAQLAQDRQRAQRYKLLTQHRQSTQQIMTAIPSPQDDVLAKAIALSDNQMNCSLVSKTWNVATLTSYQYLLDDYKLDARIRPFVPTDTLPVDANGFLHAVQQTFRAVTKSTHAPHIQREIKDLDRSKPLDLGPVVQIIEDANLVQFFKKVDHYVHKVNHMSSRVFETHPIMLDGIVYHEGNLSRPRAEKRKFLIDRTQMLLCGSAQQSAEVRDWMEKSQKSLDQLPKHLRFCNLDITTLSPEIGKFTKLTMLQLSHNRLGVLPEELFQLKNLMALDLSDNQLDALPNGIFQLTNLTTLNLSNNPLIAPSQESFSMLTKLKRLVLPITTDLQDRPLDTDPILDTIIKLFQDRRVSEALRRFKELRNDTKEAIYTEFYKITLRYIDDPFAYNCAESAFLHLPGFAGTFSGDGIEDAARIQAIENFKRKQKKL